MQELSPNEERIAKTYRAAKEVKQKRLFDMKKVIIETPYGKNPRFFSKYAKNCIKDGFDRGEAPFASHVLYATSDVLSENIEKHRDLGITAGYRWMEVADLVAFYVDHGWSIGMEAAYEQAKEFGKEIELRNLGK